MAKFIGVRKMKAYVKLSDILCEMPSYPTEDDMDIIIEAVHELFPETPQGRETDITQPLGDAPEWNNDKLQEVKEFIEKQPKPWKPETPEERIVSDAAIELCPEEKIITSIKWRQGFEAGVKWRDQIVEQLKEGNAKLMSDNKLLVENLTAVNELLRQQLGQTGRMFSQDEVVEIVNGLVTQKRAKEVVQEYINRTS